MKETISRLTIIAILVLSTLLICIACAGSSGCGAGIPKCSEPVQRNTMTCAIVKDVVDCTTPEAKTLINEFGPAILSLVNVFTGSDGAIDWSKIGAAVESAGIADGMCVLADVIASVKLRSGAQGGPGKPTFESAMIGFEQLRAKHAPGVAFHTPHGDI